MVRRRTPSPFLFFFFPSLLWRAGAQQVTSFFLFFPGCAWRSRESAGTRPPFFPLPPSPCGRPFPSPFFFPC